ncbi:hypothetical protein M501DRAFT_942910 [Patellaria atrata CBS 101060]|uniref:Nudix hydrolase domain-containing protein n=1 Tax=Patellaria atrata CBS 101060 TaxID=1346257 RepID=A0A9P4S2S2_9PEZI|nr:hypothetical protein M501DRAFT_942910 [Patellaria atrata CBS 101060]
MPQQPRIIETSDLSTSEARWVSLQKIDYIDQDGTKRTWEVASRKTRGASGIDAVAIGTILLHPSRPPSTILVLQYRPPVDATTVEWPAGLIDATETPEQAAIRELKEETGYEGHILSVSPTISSDPGMTSANMQLAMVQVELKERDKAPEQMLDEGEHIQLVIVPLEELYEKLLSYSKQEGMLISAKLFHWAAGLHFAKNTLGTLKADS